MTELQRVVYEVLRRSAVPMHVKDIYADVKIAAPHLCDDTIFPCPYCKQKHPLWKHRAAWALTELKLKQKLIVSAGRGYWRVAEKEKRREDKPTEEFHVTHTRLVEMLCDMGKTLGFVTKSEEETPDRAYRCDVTWRDFEGHSPLKVFEVELSRNIDHALSSLAHALDTWRPEQLYLILTDESDFGRVKKLTEPRLRGAFSRVSHRLRTYPWTEVKKLYDNFSVYKDFIKDLAER